MSLVGIAIGVFHAVFPRSLKNDSNFTNESISSWKLGWHPERPLPRSKISHRAVYCLVSKSRTRTRSMDLTRNGSVTNVMYGEAVRRWCSSERGLYTCDNHHWGTHPILSSIRAETLGVDSYCTPFLNALRPTESSARDKRYRAEKLTEDAYRGGMFLSQRTV